MNAAALLPGACLMAVGIVLYGFGAMDFFRFGLLFILHMVAGLLPLDSGRVTIDLPANLDARFDLESAYTENHAHTRVQSDFQLNTTETDDWDASQGTPRKYVRASGVSGSGKGLIKVRTVNGDVIVRRR